MHASPDPRLVALYHRAVVCRTFPAYRLDDKMPRELLWAIELLGVASEVQGQ